jgi:NAD(P)-dependent dehydrogenase (short-subunit alcohol dehydrogenase family)
MIFSENAFQGKRFLITGASSGIGRATALQLAACGAQLVINGRDEDRLTYTLNSLAGINHRALVADVGSLDHGHDLVMRATEDGQPLNGVFHAAGVVSVRQTKLLNDEHVDAIFSTSVSSALGIAKACAKKKALAEGSSVLFMSSVAASRGRSGMTAYAASRAALGGLTRALAAELAPRKIRVNELIAGAVETPMHEGIVKNLDPGSQDAYRNLHLLGFGNPLDVALAALFLLSDGSRWVTGSSMVVDGGYMAC